MKPYLHLIDTDTTGPRCDVTPLFADPAAFAALVADLWQPFAHIPLDFVAGIDALGFILGTAVAQHAQKGFIPLRKGGKLPVPTTQRQFVDYSGTRKTLELRHDAFPAGSRLLLVDEWVETAAQMETAVALIEAHGGIIAGIAAIAIDENGRTARLKKRYPCHALW